MSEDQGVTYSFKDLFDKLDDRLGAGFEKIDSRLDKIDARIDLKADNSRVAGIEKRVAEHEIRVDERLKPLEESLIGTTATTKIKDRAITFLSAVVVAIISALTYLAATGGFH